MEQDCNNKTDTIMARAGVPTRLPCLPTHPLVNVSLHYKGPNCTLANFYESPSERRRCGDSKPPVGMEWDPRLGWGIPDPDPDIHPGTYLCIFRYQNICNGTCSCSSVYSGRRQKPAGWTGSSSTWANTG